MTDNSLWYKDAVFYELYVRAFNDSNDDGHGDLPGVIEKLDYLKELGVDCIWLLPTYPSPLKDDGYDIADYYDVISDYGSLEDFKRLIQEAHARGMRVITDLVLNHTSDQHPWFQSARSDPNSPYRDYYVWSDNKEKYGEARIIFVDTEDSNWAWDAVAEKYYWHRFYSSQPDLNFDNPEVREEMKNVMRFWLDMGIDGFRADAVPYLFEREGTNCENLPETHVYLKEIRRLMDEEYPDRLLLCEANQWPEDLRPYFADGDEFHMGFHFPIMPRIFMSLKREEPLSIVWILNRTPPIPEDCQWCLFLRNHDELTLEMVTDGERQWMWEMYAPEPRMRLNLGIRRRLAPLLDNDPRKIELANSLLFTLPGSPVIYYGDEIGMGDNIWLPDRNGVRTPMQWDSTPGAGFSDADPGDFYSPVIDHDPYGPDQVNVADQESDPESLFNKMRRMIAVRKSYSVFGRGSFIWVSCDAASVAAYQRVHGNESLLVLNNLASSEQNVTVTLPGVQASQPIDILYGTQIPEVRDEKLIITLGPFQCLWLEI